MLYAIHAIHGLWVTWSTWDDTYDTCHTFSSWSHDLHGVLSTYFISTFLPLFSPLSFNRPHGCLTLTPPPTLLVPHHVRLPPTMRPMQQPPTRPIKTGRQVCHVLHGCPPCLCAADKGILPMSNAVAAANHRSCI